MGDGIGGAGIGAAATAVPPAAPHREQAAAVPDRAPAIPLGSRYALDPEPLGRGGMGVVHRCHRVDAGSGPDRAGPALVAKLLRPDLASDPEVRRRFLQEEEALRALDHPGIVALHDVVREGDVFALVVDAVEGPDLRSVLTDHGTLPPAVAARLAADVLEALDSAHGAGIVHRDVKPENVLLDSRPTSGGPAGSDAAAWDGVRARVTDLGIAHVASTAVGARTSGVIGTVEYVAPERFDGDAGGPASDVYGVGCLLHELLAGRTPFGGPGASAASVLRGHLERAPVRPTAVPAELWAVVAEMLAKAPARRPTAAAAARALRDLEPHLPVAASSAGTPQPAPGVRAGGDTVLPRASLRSVVVTDRRRDDRDGGPAVRAARWRITVALSLAALLVAGVAGAFGARAASRALGASGGVPEDAGAGARTATWEGTVDGFRVQHAWSEEPGEGITAEVVVERTSAAAAGDAEISIAVPPSAGAPEVVDGPAEVGSTGDDVVVRIDGARSTVRLAFASARGPVRQLASAQQRAASAAEVVDLRFDVTAGGVRPEVVTRPRFTLHLPVGSPDAELRELGRWLVGVRRDGRTVRLGGDGAIRWSVDGASAPVSVGHAGILEPSPGHGVRDLTEVAVVAEHVASGIRAEARVSLEPGEAYLGPKGASGAGEPAGPLPIYGVGAEAGRPGTRQVDVEVGGWVEQSFTPAASARVVELAVSGSGGRAHLQLLAPDGSVIATARDVPAARGAWRAALGAPAALESGKTYAVRLVPASAAASVFVVEDAADHGDASSSSGDLAPGSDLAAEVIAA